MGTNELQFTTVLCTFCLLGMRKVHKYHVVTVVVLGPDLPLRYSNDCDSLKHAGLTL